MTTDLEHHGHMVAHAFEASGCIRNKVPCTRFRLDKLQQLFP